MFKRVLIANRGEIAIRIARAAAGLGVESVAIHAAADALALHAKVATTAYALPGADPVGAYLDIDAVIAAAKATGCDAIHPGYGFLAENAAFAERCQAEGIAFIGPRPETLALFGDKVRARALAQSIDVPVAPGSAEPVSSADEAAASARSLGYPVMLKAAAGGGGRGMRRIDGAGDMPAAFARCQGEALAAFGNGAVFVEKLIDRPRHIEVQILSDGAGKAIHLFERDCSVQLRNQKLIEIAPAPNLDPGLRRRILDDALKLAHASNYLNAGTVEFLVSPQQGLHVFIECNPRIQVEHTVTEQVTGVDLVEAQFRIAAGQSLADLGLADQAAVPEPRGYAIQARVVATGEGVISAYREPTGPGVRVDAAAYLGYAPPPAYDPLFAKVIGSSPGDFASAAGRTLRALEEFQIGGLATNLGQLRAILAHPVFQSGDARTSLLSEHPELSAGAAAAPSAALTLLDAQLATLVGGRVAPTPAGPPPASLQVPPDEVGVECPMGGAVVELSVAEGASVAAGDTLMVVSAMKMETAVTAPCAGIVTAIGPAAAGEPVAAGQVVVLIAPSAITDTAPRTYGEDSWAPTLEAVKTLQDIAHARFAEGSVDPGVVRQRSRGKLTCRERIDLILDAGSFREIGSLAGFASYDGDGSIADFTPSNHVGGWGRVEGRTAVVCADDFTSRGGHADGSVGAKSGWLDRLSLDFKCPSIRLLDGSSGGGSVAAMVPSQRSSGESTAK